MAEFQTSIEIAAPPETVFDFLVTEEGMTAWMGQHATLDPREGGVFAVDIAGFPVRGEYLRIERPGRVVVSWGHAGNEDIPPGSSTVEFTLAATATGTLVELTHSNLPELGVPGHADGWRHFLPRLAIAAPGGDAGPDDWRPLGADHA